MAYLIACKWINSYLLLIYYKVVCNSQIGELIYRNKLIAASKYRHWSFIYRDVKLGIVFLFLKQNFF
jgi:hypothetical protein